MKTAGVVFDFYDDLNGSLLKTAFPTPEELPEFVKTAHILSSEERDVLRDDAFALIMSNEGKILRKFACVDAGNTLLSCLYFEENAQRLPEEAVKVAAVNLASFCHDFGFEPTNFVKMAAAAPQRTRDSMKQPIVGDEADWAARTNLVSIRGGADSGRVIPTANQMKTAGKQKEAGLVNVYVVRQNELPKEAPLAGSGQEAKAVPAPKKAPAPPAQKIAMIVDVSGKTPVHKFEKKASKRFALGNSYPLDSFQDVKAAVDYFNDYSNTMSPVDRHEYAVKTASRADELGIETSELLSRYGSTEYAPDIDAHLASRKAAAPAFGEVYDAMREKRAEVDPETFVGLLQKVDEEAGLNWYYGGDVTDPYLATFGGKEKSANAEWSWEAPDGSTLTAEHLQGLVGREEFNSSFDKDITSEFAKDPVAIFESMPAPTKAIMSRLALAEE